MIEMFHVSKTYEEGDRPALHDISLRVDKGEFVFLTGPSGAGKSTLLKLIMGSEKPTAGQILVNGQNVAKLKPRQIPHLRRQVGVVFQDFKLIPTRTIYENIALALQVVGSKDADVRQRSYRMLESVGLFHKQHVLPPKLSGGEQQRVAVARALINDPVILLADEPTGNLDAETTEAVMGLLERANARGTTIMVASHNGALIEQSGKPSIPLIQGVMSDVRRSSNSRM